MCTAACFLSHCTSSSLDLTNSDDASFSFDSTEPGSTFTCQLDAEPTKACASPQTYTNLADGEHTFAVFATDAAS